MLKHKAALAVLVSLAFAGCTKPADVSKPLTYGSDKNAKVNVADTADGFTVDVRYSRYQFVPETSALLTACRSIASGRIAEEVKQRGREIQPIDEQAIRVSTGRNIVNARTSCRAFAEVRWKR